MGPFMVTGTSRVQPQIDDPADEISKSLSADRRGEEMSQNPRFGKVALVCGAGGFIGHHLVRRLKREGFWVRGTDLKFPQIQRDRG